MKKRERTLIVMEILSILVNGPRIPTRLAQSVGVSFDAFLQYVKEIESRGFVKKSTIDGREMYSISPEGRQLLLDWQRIWEKISPDSG
ncbi:MAG TPA: winged helix-turn-helix domain-containing protein [Nitrososphaerales archaeon]|nr:winged helix-turn-helix domain-containing protein [Nitrososphaerales archaeon]